MNGVPSVHATLRDLGAGGRSGELFPSQSMFRLDVRRRASAGEGFFALFFDPLGRPRPFFTGTAPKGRES